MRVEEGIRSRKLAFDRGPGCVQVENDTWTISCQMERKTSQLHEDREKKRKNTSHDCGE